MRALALLALLGCLAACGERLSPEQQYSDGSLQETSDPGENAVVAEVRTLPWKHVEWEYKFNNRPISRLTLGGDHLFIETPDHSVVAMNRFSGQTSWIFRVNTDTPLDWSVALEPSQIWFTVRSSPPGAQVFVDGAERGRAPAELSDLTAGSHRFQLRVEGFVPIDTVIAVDEHTGTLPFVLRELPPGVLIILGDEIASSIEVDDTFVTGGVQNSGRREVLPGLHMVEVVLQRTSAVVRDTVRVLPGRVVRYDYSRRKATVEEGKP